MRVFVTGASGFVGSAVVKELLGAGHQVLGLARSDAAAEAVARAGADVQRGGLEDLDSLKSGAAGADGVIHTAFIHDFSKFAENSQVDKRAIEALGAALAGSNRPLIVTSGTALVAPGRVATEDMLVPDANGIPRVSEQTAQAMAAQGVRAASVRLPPTVHGVGDHGFIPQIIAIAREKGVSAYVGDGQNRWPAVHRLDAAVLYRLILEKAGAEGTWHGVAEQGVPTKEIAEVIARRLGLPLVSKPAEEAAGHFGFLGYFFGLDCPASSDRTQAEFGWRPTGPSLLPDLENAGYFAG
ncbi:MAG TPA: SDR family oxidoreductase [Caulobacteraceae bacterium]|nr:SDR family oxidoreductase [Caulobacteraceae bacterium]